jgi:hypothetical protein
MKFISLVTAGTGQDRSRFNEWMLQRCAPDLAITVQRCAVNTLESNPVADLVLETWAESTDVLAAIHSAPLLERASVTTYQVAEWIEKDELRAPGTPTPAVKLIAAWEGRADVARTETRRHWDEHVPLANRIHIGCVRYVRNWIEALAMSSAAYPPAYQGIAFQYFRTRDDLEQRSFDRPESVQVIQDDVGDFIAACDVMIATEYVFQSSRSSPE